MVYLDTSALVKLVVEEQETAALVAHLRARPERVTSALARTELIRAARRVGPACLHASRRLLERVELLRVSDAVLDRAGLIDPPEVRSLDAVHLASALRLEPQLEAVVTYDARMTTAAQTLGLRVDAPR